MPHKLMKKSEKSKKNRKKRLDLQSAIDRISAIDLKDVNDPLMKDIILILREKII